MEEDISMYAEMAEDSMKSALERLNRELSKVRTGKANASMFNNVMADYYGSKTPIPQMANVSTTDARTMIIQPWDKAALEVIEKAIFEANMGITPQNDGEIIRISIPPMTEERRREIGKKVKAYGEEAKVSIRTARKELMDGIKQTVKDGYPEDMGKGKEGEAQKLTDSYTNKIDKLVDAKNEDIMTI